MDERGANIDLLFRNGLKDYEVLPPPEVWDNIHPEVKKRSQTIILFRAAAVVAVLVTSGYFAIRWSREITVNTNGSVVTFDVGKPAPVFSSYQRTPLASVVKENKKVSVPKISLAVNTTVNTIPSEKEDVISLPAVSFDKKAFILNKGITFAPDKFIGSPVSSRKKTFSILPVDIGYNEIAVPDKKIQRWSIAAMASPTYYSRFSSGDDISKQLTNEEQPLLSYSGGVAVSYKVNKRFTLQTGLYYSSVGQQVDGINTFGGFQKYNPAKGDHSFEILTASGTVNTSNTDIYIIADGPLSRVEAAYSGDNFDPKKANLQYLNNSVIQNFSYVDLPVVLKYKIVDKTVDLNLIGGLSYSMLVNNSVFTKVDWVKIPVGSTQGVNSFTLSSSFGMGMEYGISDKLSLNFEPTFRYYLNPFSDVTGLRNHPYSFGIFSGISYKF